MQFSLISIGLAALFLFQGTTAAAVPAELQVIYLLSLLHLSQANLFHFNRLADAHVVTPARTARRQTNRRTPTRDKHSGTF